MPIVVFEHDSKETAGRLGRALRDQGHSLRVIQLHADDPVPPDLDDVDGVVSMGGPMNVDQADQYPWIAEELAYLKEAHGRDVPIVGICLGAQLLATTLGGEVTAMDQPEIGWAQVQLGFPGTIDPIYAGVPWKTVQFHAHGQEVSKLPPDATPLAGSKACKIQAFKVGLTSYGFQYHPEWSRDDIEAFLTDKVAKPGENGFGAGTDIEAIRQKTQQRFDMYRHLGERLTGNLASLLMPIDKRLGHHATVEPVANYKPARS